MRRTIIAIYIMALCLGMATAGVPENNHFGQYARAPWQAKCVFVNETPDNWFAEDFDDTQWSQIQGPIGQQGDLYAVTDWTSTENTCLIRRHVQINELKDVYALPIASQSEAFAGAYQLYINGQLVKSDNVFDGFMLTADMMQNLHPGDNVIGLKVSYTTDEKPFVDFGLLSDFADYFVDGSLLPVVANDQATPWSIAPAGLASTNTDNGVSAIAFAYDTEHPTLFYFDYWNAGADKLEVRADDSLYPFVTDMGQNAGFRTACMLLEPGRHSVKFEDYIENAGTATRTSYVKNLNIIEIKKSIDVVASDMGDFSKACPLGSYAGEVMLKVSGPVGTEADWESLRAMDQIKVLDLSDANIEAMRAEAFSSMKSLSYVVLPAYVKSYDACFAGCDNVRTVVCPAAIPPRMSDELLKNCDPSSISLFVPDFNLLAYQVDAYWGRFGAVSPASEAYGYYAIDDYLHLGNVPVRGKPTLDILQGGKLEVGSEANCSLKALRYVCGLESPACIVNNGYVEVDNLVTVLPIEANRWYFINLWSGYLQESQDCKIQVSHSDSEADFVMRRFDGQERAEHGPGQSWKDVDIDNLALGVGYIVRSNKDGELQFAMNGKSFALVPGNAVIEVTENYSEKLWDRDWNLIGNSYPSYYEITQLFDTHTVPITVWDYDNLTYKSMNPRDDAYRLRPLEAFFVQWHGDLVQAMDWLALADYDNGAHFMPSNVPGSDNRHLFNIRIVGNGLMDQTRVVLSDESEMGYEPARDAAKFMSMERACPQIFTVDGQGNRLSINERPMGDGVIALGLTIGVEGAYAISGSRLDGEAWLYDAERKAYANLGEGHYEFDAATPGDILNRFYLNLNHAPASLSQIGCATAEVQAEAGIIRVKAGVDSKVAVSNACGMQVYAGCMQSGMVELQVAPGLYLVTIDNKTYKAIVK